MTEVPAGTGKRGAVWMQRPPMRLRKLVREASRALEQLDADRLEELARCCEALNREPEPMARHLRAEAREAAAEVAVLGSVLEQTRANLAVLDRLREVRLGRLEYTAVRSAGWRPAGGRYGND